MGLLRFGSWGIGNDYMFLTVVFSAIQPTSRQESPAGTFSGKVPL